MKIVVTGPPGYSNILPAFQALEPYESMSVTVVALCDAAREWAIHFRKPIVEDESGGVVISLWDDDLI
jgi:hypothetical protein